MKKKGGKDFIYTQMKYKEKRLVQIKKKKKREVREGCHFYTLNKKLASEGHIL